MKSSENRQFDLAAIFGSVIIDDCCRLCRDGR